WPRTPAGGVVAAGAAAAAAAGAASAGAVVAAGEAAAVASDRFAVQSPSANPPKSALPVIVSPATLPFNLISNGMPWKLIVKATFKSSPSTVPAIAVSPAGDLIIPSTLLASCLKVTFDVFAPCGELIVTSQSTATVVCASAGTVVSRPNARTASRVRIMTVAPER